MLLLAELELLFEANWLLVTLELFDEVLLPTFNYQTTHHKVVALVIKAQPLNQAQATMVAK